MTDPTRPADGDRGAAAGAPLDERALARVLPGRYPLRLVDRVLDLDAGARVSALKTVSAGEPYFGGHFPGRPLMPGVLICEALAQAGALLVAGSAPPPGPILRLRGLDRARFRHPVVPGDRLDLEVRVLSHEGTRWRLRGTATVGEQVVAEADFSAEEEAGPGATAIHPTAVVAPGAELGTGVSIGPYAVVGPQVRIGDRTVIGSHAVIEGHTTIGTESRIFQFASVGAPPQDLKYRGEDSRLEIGDRNIIREFATLNLGTAGGGMVTAIGNGNLLMNYAHIGHDSRVGDHCVLANGATLAGHVTLADWVIVGGLAAIHQFVRIGESGFLGGGAMVVRDVPPFCIAAGDRARLRGLNVVGLKRRGFTAERVRAIKRAYRMLFLGEGTLAETRARCAAELGAYPDVGRMLEFIAGSARGICATGAPEDEDDE